MSTEGKKPFPRRRFEVAVPYSDAMSKSIDLWIDRDRWVSEGGVTAKERAWACYQEWVVGEKNPSKIPLEPQLFYKVMEKRFPVSIELDGYGISISSAYVEKGSKASKRSKSSDDEDRRRTFRRGKSSTQGKK